MGKLPMLKLRGREKDRRRAGTRGAWKHLCMCHGGPRRAQAESKGMIVEHFPELKKDIHPLI